MSFQDKAIHFVKKFPAGSIWQARYLCFPASVVAATLSLSQVSFSIAERFFYFFCGVLLWTLLEYVLHRWVLHYLPKNPIGQAVMNRFHVDHHHDPHDKALVCIPLVVCLPLWACVLGLLYLLFQSGPIAWLVTSGVAVMMVLYDITHFSTHYMPATNWYLKLLKRQHMEHHFSDHTQRFGVTSPVWDYVFGTISKK